MLRDPGIAIGGINVAQWLCRNALGKRVQDHKEEAREEFAIEYATYLKSWEVVKKAISAEKKDEARHLAWVIATNLVLINPRVMSFYLSGGFTLYEEVSFSSEQVSVDDWSDIKHLRDVFADHLQRMLQLEKEISIEQLKKMVTVERLRTTFSLQEELMHPSIVGAVNTARKETLYTAMGLYSKCRLVIRTTKSPKVHKQKRHHSN